MPSEFGFEPHSQRCGLFLVLGLFDTICAQSEPFWAIVWPFLGHIVQFGGNKRLLAMRKSRRTWSVATVSVSVAILNGFKGCFSGTENAQFWEGTS